MTFSGPKELARAAYRAVPFKRAMYMLLRQRWTPPAWLTEHLYFKGPFELQVDGRAITVENYNSPHETALFWLGLDGCHEAASLRYWRALSRKASLVIDVGANVGLYSLMAKAANPEATVYAFEPVERFFERLQRNCRRNHFDVRCFPFALSDEDGEAPFWDLPVDHHYHASLSRLEVAQTGGAIEKRVSTKTLRGVLAREQAGARIDLMKIDVEGWEPQVLRGAGELLEARPSILLEIKRAEQARAIEPLVGGLGYWFYDIDETRGAVRRSRLGPSRRWNWLLCQPEVAAGLALAPDILDSGPSP